MLFLLLKPRRSSLNLLFMSAAMSWWRDKWFHEISIVYASSLLSEGRCCCVAGDKAHKLQALKFLHIALATVLDLRGTGECELPGRPVDKLAASLFGGCVPVLNPMACNIRCSSPLVFAPAWCTGLLETD